MGKCFIHIMLNVKHLDGGRVADCLARVLPSRGYARLVSPTPPHCPTVIMSRRHSTCARNGKTKATPVLKQSLISILGDDRRQASDVVGAVGGGGEVGGGRLLLLLLCVCQCAWGEGEDVFASRPLSLAHPNKSWGLVLRYTSSKWAILRGIVGQQLWHIVSRVRTSIICVMADCCVYYYSSAVLLPLGGFIIFSSFLFSLRKTNIYAVSSSRLFLFLCTC